MCARANFRPEPFMCYQVAHTQIMSLTHKYACSQQVKMSTRHYERGEIVIITCDQIMARRLSGNTEIVPTSAEKEKEIKSQSQ